ncbi:MAG: GDSL-type esterase/lipase family protein [Akkermansiaceae bacterium]|nr:GDSL-type esterase/lipase family protein [Akkermansiaceae bacterium]
MIHLSLPGHRILQLRFFTLPFFVSSLATSKPVVIWASDPVQAGESVMVRGDDFGSKPGVEISISKNGKSSDWCPAPVFQQTATTLKFGLPENIGDGIVSFRIKHESEISEVNVVNAPKVWWIQGDETETATPGGWLRLFGLNMNLHPGARLILKSADDSVNLTPVRIDEFALNVKLPASLRAGVYSIRFENGLVHPSAALAVGNFTIAPKRSFKDSKFDVIDFGAVPAEPGYLQYTTAMMAEGQVDSADAVQRAVDAAGKAGGGVVTLPRGIFVLSHGITMPVNVTLRGAGKDLTVLSYVDDMLPRQQKTSKLYWGAQQYEPIQAPDTPPHPFLIRGLGHFAVEDMAIYAINHQAGILSELPMFSPDAGHVTVRRVIMRLDRFINNEKSDRHYTNAEEVFLKRWKDIRRMGAIDLGGPNNQITDCDIYSSTQVLMLNGSSGYIARNKFSATPHHWTIFGRRTEKVIFEDNDCSDGGVSLNSVHDMVTNDGKTRIPSIYSREIYIARNTMKDSFRGDRDGGFNSDFHAPVGIYTGNVATCDGTQLELPRETNVSDFASTWKGAVVVVLDGKGAGQYRSLMGGEGKHLIVDRPWDVPLDTTSFISVCKALDHVIAVGNEAHDAGNTVLFWCGGIEVVAARNKSVRAGAIEQTTLSYEGQVLPGLRAQFFDNEITEGISWGASFIFPRGAFIGSITYPPIYNDRKLQAEAGKPVTAPDYHGPMALEQVFRRNHIANNGRFMVGGNVQNILFENGTVRNAEIGVEVTSRGGRWADFLDGGPSDILARNNQFENVTIPYAGDRLNQTKMIPEVQASNSATLPVPNEKAGWLRRHDSINERAAQGNVDLIYLGDSIVQNFEKQGRDVWNRYYSHRNALNLGISGDRTQHLLWRLDHGNVDGISPKLAIVMIGQNNGGHNTASEIADGITAVVQRLKSKLPDTKILLLGIFQRREKPTPERSVLDEANSKIATLADDDKVFYMNINSIFLRSDGTIPSELMPDFEHPSPHGHRVWAEAIESKVAELMGDERVPGLSELMVR